MSLDPVHLTNHREAVAYMRGLMDADPITYVPTITPLLDYLTNIQTTNPCAEVPPSPTTHVPTNHLPLPSATIGALMDMHTITHHPECYVCTLLTMVINPPHTHVPHQCTLTTYPDPQCITCSYIPHNHDQPPTPPYTTCDACIRERRRMHDTSPNCIFTRDHDGDCTNIRA